LTQALLILKEGPLRRKRGCSCTTTSSETGRRDSDVDKPWIHDEVEIGRALLSFRDRVIENNYGLTQPHEMLAVNFVFLVESEFQTGGLQSEVDDGAWTALWRSIGRLNTPASSPEVVSEAHHWAHLASCNGYEDFVRLLDDTPPSSEF
ncbi:hypothetical protein BGX31_011319, partial [Mortierella sp. GBA43]